MTRDEAIKTYHKTVHYGVGLDVCELSIDVFVALGMLKLDGDRVDDAPSYGKAFLLYGADRFNSADHMQRAFEAANLKIVEATPVSRPERA